MPPEPIQRLSRLVPLHEVYARIDAFVQPVTPREEPVWQALGHVLARDVEVADPVPPHPRALRDGWAVAADRLADAGPYAPVALEPPPVWVECGERMPAGTDAVLAPDAVASTAGSLEALAPVGPGEDVLPAGMDAQPRAPLRKAGERLRLTDVAALQAAGIDRVWTRAPRIAFASARPNAQGGKDFVGNLIADAVQREGTWVSSSGEPRELDLKRLLTRGQCDAIGVVGGTGMGRDDASVDQLARVGHVEIHGMGIRPGETAALGTVDGRPVLLLPGRLDAALAAWLLVGRRFHARLSGRSAADPAVTVKLARKIVSTIGLAEVIPVGYGQDGAEPLASGYLSVQALSRAAGWVFVPPESEGFPQGATVELHRFP